MLGAAALGRCAAPAALSRHVATSSRLHTPLCAPPAQRLAPRPPLLLAPPLAHASSSSSTGDSGSSTGDSSSSPDDASSSTGGKTPRPRPPILNRRPMNLSRQELASHRETYLEHFERSKQLLSKTPQEFLRLGIVDYDRDSAAEFFPGDSRRPSFVTEMKFEFMSPPRKGLTKRQRRRMSDFSRPFATRPLPAPEVRHADFGMPHLFLLGRRMYFASAEILRVTILALFSNPSLTLERIHVVDDSSERPTNAYTTPLDTKKRHAFIVRHRFEGTLRVLGTHKTFYIRSKYKLTPHGDICVHRIERVEPEPGGKIWDGLRSTFERFAGVSDSGHSHPVPACMGRSPARSAVLGRSTLEPRRMFSSAAARGSSQQLGAVERRLSLSFTCTAGEVACGHRSAHEFSAKSYEKGIVIVQCPKCKNRHLIADHLGWFKDSHEARTVEGIVAAHGGRVRRGSLRDNGETLEIDSDEGEGAGAGIGEPVPDAQPGADDDKWWKEPK